MSGHGLSGGGDVDHAVLRGQDLLDTGVLYQLHDTLPQLQGLPSRLLRGAVLLHLPGDEVEVRGEVLVVLSQAGGQAVQSVRVRVAPGEDILGQLGDLLGVGHQPALGGRDVLLPSGVLC